MALIDGTCSHCGGKIEFEDGLKRGVCVQCGTPYVVERQNIENLLIRARQFEETGKYVLVRKYVSMVLDIDTQNKEALLIYDRNREYCFRLSMFKYTFLLKKHADEVEARVNNGDLEQALALFEKHALLKLRKGSLKKILKKWALSGLNSVLDLEFCTKEHPAK